MSKQLFFNFLTKEDLGYQCNLSDIEDYEDIAFCYTYAKNFNNSELKTHFFYIPDNQNFEIKAHQIHSNLWNENKDIAFWVIGNEKTYLVDNKAKPSENQSINKSIASFDYGVNNPNYKPDQLEKLQKSYFDTGYWVDFVIKKSKQKQEVDKEFLLDLIALRQDLISINNDFETIHLLILRCLFIKYLEDRKIYGEGYLLNILENKEVAEQSKKVEGLLSAFNKIAEINGDIFKYETVKKENILPEYLPYLGKFFGSYEYRNKQGNIFPYKFDKIPIQLISNVYEAFLSDETRGENGIFYTPSFAVDFVLAQTLNKKLAIDKTDVSVLDPSCGSGAFLVESFKRIIKAKESGKQLLDDEKFKQRRKILSSNQVCGIDIDKKALQIAVFSLYVALLEDIGENYIKKQIEERQPLLPSLLGKQLVQANTITATENTFEGYIFDCVVGNPPWGSAEDIETKNKIDNLIIKPYKKKEGGRLVKDKYALTNIYRTVSHYQKSQAFFLRINQWLENDSIACLVLNNAIFFDETAKDFRTEILTKYDISYFYELSNIEIFKKRVIGKIKGKEIKIGADEPCAIVVFNKKQNEDNKIKYISPKKDTLNKHLQTIHYTSADCKKIKQADLKEEAMLWRIFVQGNWASYSLIKTKFLERDENLKYNAFAGMQAVQNMHSLGNPDWRYLIDTSSDFLRYGSIDISKLIKFDFNQNLDRGREGQNPTIFRGDRILLAAEPYKIDNLKLKAIYLSNDINLTTDINTNSIVHKRNVVVIKLPNVSNKIPYLCCINSKFIGYYLYHISAQWGKGKTRNSLRIKEEIEKLPFPFIDFESQEVRDLENLVSQIQNCYANGNIAAVESLENEIDEIVFDLYGLVDSEKEMIREFYQINVEREGKKQEVTKTDLEKYIETFKDVFETVLNHDLTLQTSYKISPNLGAAISFEIVKKTVLDNKIDNNNKNLEFLNLVKQKQVREEEMTKILSEEKIKIHFQNKFYIIKSKFFKDWTPRQAKLDAQEEVGSALKQLYNK